MTILVCPQELRQSLFDPRDRIVIPTGAKRSGGTCGSLPYSHALFTPGGRGSGRLTTKISNWLARGVGQNLEQACDIFLTLSRPDRSLHEVNVRIWNGVA
jgi:hypothetical protein